VTVLFVNLQFIIVLLTIPQVIVGRSYVRTGGHAVRIKIVLGDESNPAILSHLDHFNAVSSALKHPVIIPEARNNALDGTLDAKRFAAAHA
jgi:hypothetical protein